jgi:hypothetical protein
MAVKLRLKILTRMSLKLIMEYVFGIIKELLTLFRVSKESKSKEIEIRNQSEFKEREVKQQTVTQKDNDEKLISEVVHAKTPEEEETKMNEIRKIISK